MPSTKPDESAESTNPLGTDGDAKAGPVREFTGLGSDFPLKLLARGKVRELYEVDATTLLMVASDRISAYDVNMGNAIPYKGVLLTQLSLFWYNFFSSAIPSLRTHFLSVSLPAQQPELDTTRWRVALKNRFMHVRKYKIFPIEAIVRGYITGSAWKEYQENGTVNGKVIPKGLQESQGFPEGPIYTPSTKAEAGSGLHDENITIEKAAQIIGPRCASRIESLALSIYKTAHAYAKSRGVIIADTKFEFGLDEATDEIVLVDEVLTPDSSRFWDDGSYRIGHAQDSMDKQYLRDWLTSEGLKGKEGVSMTEEVKAETARKYQLVFEKLTGKKWATILE